MVFENLTLFEFRLEGAQIGPRTMDGSDADDAEIAASGSADGGPFRPVLLVVMLAIGAALLYRRPRSNDVELDAESEAVEADLAEAQ